MRTVIDLTELDRHFRVVDRLLIRPVDGTCLRRVTARLEEIDTVLAGLVANDEMTDDVVSQLGRVRDGLSGHLEAAVAMQDLELPDQTVAGLLQRGMSAARTGIAAINASISHG